MESMCLIRLIRMYAFPDLEGTGERRSEGTMIDKSPARLEQEMRLHLGSVARGGAAVQVLRRLSHISDSRRPSCTKNVQKNNHTREPVVPMLCDTSRNGGGCGGVHESSLIMSSTLPAHRPAQRTKSAGSVPAPLVLPASVRVHENGAAGHLSLCSHPS